MNYRERLAVPIGWWAVGMFFTLTFVTAVGFYAGPAVAGVGGVIAAVGVAAALLWYGRPVVAVDASGFHAGDALLEWAYAGEARPLDAAGTRNRIGAEGDHAAWLLLRAYVPGAVEVAVIDAADPHPYWLVSTRHPEALVAAIERCRAISPSGGESSRG